VIGVLPGKNWQYPSDNILIVTTYWDIQGASVADNGGGLALLMETVRVLMLDPRYRPDYSVLFVAFDKRHDGSVGSKRFINEYVVPHVLRKYKCKIQGLINIGSILKYSNRNNTQIFPTCLNDNYETLNSTGAYYVLLGEKPSNIEKLNEVINDFYKDEENTYSTTDSNRRNSPMIIKLIS